MCKQYINNKQYQDKSYNRFILENSAPMIRLEEYQSIGEMNTNTWARLYNAMKLNNLVDQDFQIEDAFTLQFIQ